MAAASDRPVATTVSRSSRTVNRSAPSLIMYRPIARAPLRHSPARRTVAQSPQRLVRLRAVPRACPGVALIDGRIARTESGDWFALMDTVGHHGGDLSSVVPTGFRSADHTEASALIDVSPGLSEHLRCDCPSKSAVSA